MQELNRKLEKGSATQLQDKLWSKYFLQYLSQSSESGSYYRAWLVFYMAF